MSGRTLDYNVSIGIQLAKEQGWVTEVHAIGNTENGTLLLFNRHIFTAEFSYPRLYGKLERFDDGKGSKHEIAGLTALHEILQSSNEALDRAFEIKPYEEKPD